MQGAVHPTTANPSTSSWILVLGLMTAWTIFRGPNLGGMHSAGSIVEFTPFKIDPGYQIEAHDSKSLVEFAFDFLFLYSLGIYFRHWIMTATLVDQGRRIQAFVPN